jgi:hypothetical protein
MSPFKFNLYRYIEAVAVKTVPTPEKSAAGGVVSAFGGSAGSGGASAR